MDAKSIKFFRDTGMGTNSPSSEATPLLTVGNHNIAYFYKIYEGPFSKHINASIPLKIDNDIATIEAIQATFTEASILDIGSSDSTWGKTLCYLNNTYNVTAIDPCSYGSHLLTGKGLTNFRHLDESFSSDCCGKKEHNPFNDDFKGYDIVRESMTFQFMSKFRLDEVYNARRMMSSNGIFLTEEKFTNDSSTVYKQNEHKKNMYKRLNFAFEDIIQKEDLVEKMESRMVNYNDYVNILELYFNYVGLYYRSGNFRGLIATDSKERYTSFIDKIRKHKELTSNKYNEDEHKQFSIFNGESPLEYEWAIDKSRFVVNDLDEENIHSIHETSNGCFCSLSKDGEFTNIIKPDHAIHDSIIDSAYNARYNEALVAGFKDVHLNVFDLKHNLVKKYSDLGFSIEETIKFNPELANDDVRDDELLNSLEPDVVYMTKKVR